MRTQFSRLSSSHTSLLRLVERKLKTGFGNELSPPRLSPPRLSYIAWAFCSDALRRRSDCQSGFPRGTHGTAWTRLPGEHFHCRCGLGCFCVCLVVWVLFLSCGSIPGRFSKQSLQFPVVDRPCLVLVRHCREKKIL